MAIHPWGMGKQRRPYLPGAIFHLAARTIHKEHLITGPLRGSALRAVAQAVPQSGLRLLAVAIMSNHLHLVVQQGERELAALMQPLLRRLALDVHAHHRRTGPVFWRPYLSVHCRTLWHARNCIVYVHLNAVRAGMCADPGDYPWTSHALYDPAAATVDAGTHAAISAVIDPALALPLFATTRGRASAQLHDDYRAVVAWRIAQDWAGADRDPAVPDEEMPVPPPSLLGDPDWCAGLGPLYHATSLTDPSSSPPPWPPAAAGRTDMARVARAVIQAEEPRLTLAMVRGRRGGAGARRVRHLLIRRLHAHGFRNRPIARFLAIGESTVSEVIRGRLTPRPRMTA